MRSEALMTNEKRTEQVTADEADSVWTPVIFDRCDHVDGPFYHGTNSALEVGDHLVPGHGSNYHDGRISNNIYFSALVDTAVWGAELAVALAGNRGRGRIYVVEPMGPFEDDPNVTNKRFRGNITESYRTRHPLVVLKEHTAPPLMEMPGNIEFPGVSRFRA